MQSCPFWENWSQWSPCTATCGGGSRTHMRSCVNGEIGDVGCRGDSMQEDICNIQVIQHKWISKYDKTSKKLLAVIAVS